MKKRRFKSEMNTNLFDRMWNKAKSQRKNAPGRVNENKMWWMCFQISDLPLISHLHIDGNQFVFVFKKNCFFLCSLIALNTTFWWYLCLTIHRFKMRYLTKKTIQMIIFINIRYGKTFQLTWSFSCERNGSNRILV